MAKRKVKSEVSIRLKQSRKGTRKGEPIVATVRIGQPSRRATGATERTAKPAFRGNLEAMANIPNVRPSDFLITSGFKNLETAQSNILRSLEEQRKQIVEVSRNTDQLMAERAGLRVGRQERIGGNRELDMESISSRTTFIPPSSGRTESEFMFDEESTARRIERIQRAVLQNAKLDPRRVPSMASSVLSEPPPDIQEVAGAEEVSVPENIVEDEVEQAGPSDTGKKLINGVSDISIKRRATLYKMTYDEVRDFVIANGRLPSFKDLSIPPPKNIGRPRKVKIIN